MKNLIALLAVLLLPAAALAGGYAIPNTNPRDEAMGGANVANQTGPEAAIGNMSAVAGTEGLQASISDAIIYRRTEWTDTSGTQGGGSETTIPKAAFPPNLNVTYGGKLGNGMGYGFGVAVSAPGGGLINWNSNWEGRTDIIYVKR